MKKRRLDDMLIFRGSARNRAEAARLIIAGDVCAQNQKAIAPSQMFPEDSVIEIRTPSKYVGRGGEKLAHAIKIFGISVLDKTALDIGSATGGFTDVFLQNGVAKVYAVDTAKGKLDIKLRGDPRVIIMEETNILYLEKLPELVDIASVDVSLTSLRLVFSALSQFLKKDGKVVALFKPQYEVHDARALCRGIVKDDAVRKKTLADFIAWLGANGWRILGQAESPIRGSEGNTEFLLYSAERRGKRA